MNYVIYSAASARGEAIMAQDIYFFLGGEGGMREPPSARSAANQIPN